ncbi:MAG TPA: prefoldin subunit alpha [Nitrososphaeraceae archaeon]|jgi:prefoldin alpha subunit|nr:prefoldin subunit alpha [Nitrososphaeraceae archaeon]HSF50872.1 prefoldin subunit alpha [Nitrososphaeraceae archaeon]
MSKANTPQKSAIEQRINELVQHSRTLELYLNEVLERETTVTKLIEEARLASYALQNISLDKENEALMPIGVGVYLKTNIPSIDKLLVNVGAGVAIEKTREDTLNYIESRIKEFEIGLNQLRDQKKQITSQLEQIQQQVNSMLHQAS